MLQAKNFVMYIHVADFIFFEVIAVEHKSVDQNIHKKNTGGTPVS